jgi:hypothetical protein
MSTHSTSPTDSNIHSTTGAEIGDYIIDTEDESDPPDVGRIINLPGSTAAEWDAYKTKSGEQLTVYDTNPEYDPEEIVVVCLFLDQLEEHYPQWNGDEPLDLAAVTNDGVTHYAFPRSRVKIGNPETLIPPSEELKQLESEVSSGATTELRFYDGRYTLHIEKLGIEYEISADGEVYGEGPHADAYRKKANEMISATND